MTVSSTMNGRTAIFIPMANEPIEAGYWIYTDTLEKVDKITIVIEKDGDMWCAHDTSFENLQESKAGFGDTPDKAVHDYFEIKDGVNIR
jgi:hypothetical protein